MALRLGSNTNPSGLLVRRTDLLVDLEKGLRPVASPKLRVLWGRVALFAALLALTVLTFTVRRNFDLYTSLLMVDIAALAVTQPARRRRTHTPSPHPRSVPPHRRSRRSPQRTDRGDLV
jgi:hypothetical protein